MHAWPGRARRARAASSCCGQLTYGTRECLDRALLPLLLLQLLRLLLLRRLLLRILLLVLAQAPQEGLVPHRQAGGQRHLQAKAVKFKLASNGHCRCRQAGHATAALLDGGSIGGNAAWRPARSLAVGCLAVYCCCCRRCCCRCAPNSARVPGRVVERRHRSYQLQVKGRQAAAGAAAGTAASAFQRRCLQQAQAQRADGSDGPVGLRACCRCC